jgi:hypothetical protein
MLSHFCHIAVSLSLYRTVSHALKHLLLRPSALSSHSLPQVVVLHFWARWSLEEVVLISHVSSGSSSTQ